VEQLLGEQQLGVADGEAHGRVSGERPERAVRRMDGRYAVVVVRGWRNGMAAGAGGGLYKGPGPGAGVRRVGWSVPCAVAGVVCATLTGGLTPPPACPGISCDGPVPRRRPPGCHSPGTRRPA
jgi:hypothetical protein